jgi:4-amino-4-deoxy-L-arabinose transferase-like glycosyltransferase
MILIAFTVLTLMFVFVVPPFESPDEYYHVAMIQKLATDGQLPVQTADALKTDWHQEGSQPPLYYMLGSLIFRWFDRSDYEQVRQLNPNAYLGQPQLIGNKNYVLHDPMYPPTFNGTRLGIYVLRLFSVMLGCITVYSIYQATRVIFPNQRSISIIAGGLVAFNPQFAFISASINNDNLVITLNSLILWQTLIMLKEGFNTRRSIALSILIALATISKLSGLVMVVMVALAGLYVSVVKRDWRGLVKLGALMLGVWLVLGAWWYIRNLTLYNELFGIQTMLDIFGRRSPLLTPLELITLEGDGMLKSYWGVFGWFNILAPSWFYIFTDMLSILIVIGIVIQVGRRIFRWGEEDTQQQHLLLFFLALTFAVGFASFMSWTMQTYASQGRLLFPYNLPIAILSAWGLIIIVERWGAIPFTTALATIAFYMPLNVVYQAYTPQPTYTELPATAMPIYARFGDIELLGYETVNQRYTPGDQVTLTLYWRPLAQNSPDLSVFFHLIKPPDTIFNTLTSYPNNGSRRTSTWQPNLIYSDTYQLSAIDYTGDAFLLEGWIGWWNQTTDEGIEPVDANGQPIGVVRISLGGYAVLGNSTPPIVNPRQADFGGIIRLRGYDWDNGTLRLWWQSRTTTLNDYTVFVFLKDANGEVVRQGDAPPSLPTQYWRLDEQHLSTHILNLEDLPDGEYTIEIGWYLPADFTRLNTRYTDDVYLLTTINVNE